MKHFKKFNNDVELDVCIHNSFISPHVFLNKKDKSFSYCQKYKRVQYVGATDGGNQYVDLGCKLINNSDPIRLQLGLIGNYKIEDNAEFLSCGNDGKQYGFRLRYKDTNNRSLNIQTKFKNNLYTTYDNSYNSYNYFPISHLDSTISEELIIDVNLICTDESTFKTSDHTCLLFCGRSSSDALQRYGYCNFTFVKLYKGGILVRNLIPVKTAYTNIPGFYDTVEDKFYQSNTSTPLVAGQEI